MKFKRIQVAVLLVVATGCATPSHAISSAEMPSNFIMPCSQDAKRQAERSAELQAIVNADQKDRKDSLHWTLKESLEVFNRDTERRKRVGEIFGEGCFKTAADFSAGALVYQHGDTPDHFYQTFIWAKRAVDLGDSKQKYLIAFGLDRYLVNIGKKQLFGSQANHGPSDPCFCLQQVEKSFSDDERVKYTGHTLAEELREVDSYYNKDKSCEPAHECDDTLQPTPAGSVPGFW